MTDLIKAVQAVAASSGRGLERVSAPLPDTRPGTATDVDSRDDGGAGDASVTQAIDEIADALPRREIDLTYRVDPDLQRVIVEVVDRRDGTVLRQIPGEEALRLARSMKDGNGGLLQASA